MEIIDIANLSLQERLDLIGRLWDSIDTQDVPLTPAQKAELDRRLATLDADAAQGRNSDTVISELEQRYR